MAQKRKPGDLLKIPLQDGSSTYARVLTDASYAFYDARAAKAMEPLEVVAKPILFIIAVMDRAVTSGRWPIVGYVPLDEGMQIPPKFIQDAMDKKKFRIYENGQVRPASRAECMGLERAAVWQPEFVEERLIDFYAGRPNRIVSIQQIV